MSRGRRGGSGNAQHGDESSRYDCDDLHDANPLVLGTRAGRPSDAPIPLCLCKTPASTIPRSGSIAGGMAPEYLSPRPVEWFKGNWQDQDSGIGIGRGTPTMNRRRQGGFQPAQSEKRTTTGPLLRNTPLHQTFTIRLAAVTSPSVT